MNHRIVNVFVSSLAITLLFAGNLPGQVQTVEKELRNNSTNAAPASNTLQANPDLLNKAKDASTEEAMGLLDAKGYFALFTNIRKEALTQTRYTILPEKQQQLDRVIDKMGQTFPQSFEYHYAAYLNGQNDTAMGYHLLEASRIAPNRTEIYHDMVAYYELSANSEKKVQYCNQIAQKNVYDPQLYQYGRNLFNSMEAGAFVFTRGEWDTYPLWVLQNVNKVRTDITVLQLDLLQQQHYFNRKMAGFKLKKGAYQRFLANKASFFRELAAATSGKAIYLSLTVDQPFITANSDILYNTGLAMKLSTKPIDNLTILSKNWLTFDLTFLNTTSGNADLNRMTGNYILPMGMLYHKAIEAGQQQEAEKLKQQMLNIAKKAGKLKEMEEYFE